MDMASGGEWTWGGQLNMWEGVIFLLCFLLPLLSSLGYTDQQRGWGLVREVSLGEMQGRGGARLVA